MKRIFIILVFLIAICSCGPVINNGWFERPDGARIYEFPDGGNISIDPSWSSVCIYKDNICDSEHIRKVESSELRALLGLELEDEVLSYEVLTKTASWNAITDCPNCPATITMTYYRSGYNNADAIINNKEGSIIAKCLMTHEGNFSININSMGVSMDIPCYWKRK